MGVKTTRAFASHVKRILWLKTKWRVPQWFWAQNTCKANLWKLKFLQSPVELRLLGLLGMVGSLSALWNAYSAMGSKGKVMEGQAHFSWKAILNQRVPDKYANYWTGIFLGVLTSLFKNHCPTMCLSNRLILSPQIVWEMLLYGFSWPQYRCKIL